MAEEPNPLAEGQGLAQSKSMSKIRPERSCRDLLFLIAFVVFWVGMWFVAGVAFTEGDPRMLIYGLDYQGNLCDADGGRMEGYKIRYWPNTNEVWAAGSATSAFQLADAKSFCLKKCPQPGNGTLKWVCNYPGDPDNGVLQNDLNLTLGDWHDMEYNYYTALSDEKKTSSHELKGPCYPVVLPSVDEYWSCQYYGSYRNNSVAQWQELGGVELTDDAGGVVAHAIKDMLTSPVNIMNRYVADLFQAWKVLVLAGIVLPFLLSFVWLMLMRFFVGVMAWLTVLLVNVVALAVTLFTLLKAGIIGDDAITAYIGEDNVADFEELAGTDLDASEENRHVMTGVAVFACILNACLLIFTVIMIPRIHLAVAILKVACKAVASVPTVVFTPLVPFIMLVGLSVYWVVTALYLFSAGEITQRECELSEYGSYCGYDVKWDDDLQYMMLYHLFGLLWTMQFIVAFTYCSIAGTIANYYWTQGEINSASQSPVLAAMGRTLRYHLGSLAIGSFITALFQFIRIIVKYIEHQCKEMKENSDLVKFVFCCVNSCLWCMQAIVNFINRNAYIVIAIDGTAFCTSATRACQLILNNILRVAAVNVIGDTILFLGKLVVALGCAFCTYLYLETPEYKSGDDKVSSPLVVIVMVLLSSFAIATSFMAVVEMAVDTVLLSYCIDTEENDGTAKHAPPLLTTAMKLADRAEEERKAEKQRKLEEKASKMAAKAAANATTSNENL